MKHCFNLVVKVCFSMSPGRVFQRQGMLSAGRDVLRGLGGFWLAYVSDCKSHWHHNAKIVSEGHSMCTYV